MTIPTDHDKLNELHDILLSMVMFQYLLHITNIKQNPEVPVLLQLFSKWFT